MADAMEAPAAVEAEEPKEILASTALADDEPPARFSKVRRQRAQRPRWRCFGSRGTQAGWHDIIVGGAGRSAPTAFGRPACARRQPAPACAAACASRQPASLPYIRSQGHAEAARAERSRP